MNCPLTCNFPSKKVKFPPKKKTLKTLVIASGFISIIYFEIKISFFFINAQALTRTINQDFFFNQQKTVKGNIFSKTTLFSEIFPLFQALKKRKKIS